MGKKETKNTVTKKEIEKDLTINTQEFGEVTIEKDSIVENVEELSKITEQIVEPLTIIEKEPEVIVKVVQIPMMTLETFLNHHFLSSGKRLYYLKTFGANKEIQKTFSDWSEQLEIK